MRNVRYRFHPGDYELGENEKFYSDMEARGWRLVKRGGRLSKFVSVEPSRARYRIEAFYSGFLEEPGLSEGQLAVFEDCGWEHIDSRGFLHIFRAPQGSDAPEFYADPRQQAATLRGVRRNLWWSIAAAAAIVALCFISILSFSRGGWQWDAFKRLVQIPALFAFYFSWLLFSLYQLVRDAWKINRTYSQLKKGIPLDHNPREHHLHKFISRALVCLALLSLLALAVQLLRTESRDLPMEPDGPYILLRDLGWEGERTTGMFSDRESGVTFTPSPLADYWEVYEVVEAPADDQVWLYQYVYRLRVPALRDALVRALMNDSVFARSEESFQPVEIDGLDNAWIVPGGLEAVAVQGNLVFYTEYLGVSPEPPDMSAVLEAWSAYGGGAPRGT